MNRIVQGVVLVLLLLGSANAQDPIKIFKMHIPVTETFVGCLYQSDAVAITDALAKGDESVGVAKFNADVCRMVTWTVTYKELVHITVGKNGEHITVYRGQVNRKDIFVPMIGWTHEVI